MATKEVVAGTGFRLTQREEIAEGTMAFDFTKPKSFEFRAGQYVDVTLLNPPETDNEGNTRTFSIISAPFEDHLTVATRMRDSAFKRSLKLAHLGTPLHIGDAGGSFVLHRSAQKPAVFLAGGIGIAPFVSILRQVTHDKAEHQIYLFYSNRRPEDAAFLEELNLLAARNPNLHFLPTMTEMDKSQRQWNGAKGFINAEMLKKHLPAIKGPIFYLAGPQAMVAALRKVLDEAGVEEDDIRTEEFSGY